jgi:hypothetical protein
MAKAVSLAFVTLLLGAHQALCQGVPANGDYVRRAYVSVVKVNNYLYIDGGQISQFVNGTTLENGPGMLQLMNLLP